MKHNAPFQSRFVVHYLTNKVPNTGRSLVVRFVLSLSVVIALTAVVPLNRWTASAQTTQTSTVVLSPADTYLGLNAANNSTATTLNTYTWPNNQVANAIVMKFDLSAVPAGAVIQSAKLKLALVDFDQKSDTAYTITAHKIVGRNPDINAATGFMSSGSAAWAPSTCCYNNTPLAQGNISQPYASVAVSKTTGFKSWTITNMVQEWVQQPATNFGVLLNSDATVGQDRYRYFASMEYADPSLRPALEITYSAGTVTTPPPPSSSGGGTGSTTPSVFAIIPSDTSINLDANNNSNAPVLTTYTWPEYQVGNAILMKFDLSQLPQGATIQDATLNLALVDTDNTADATYTITAHKVQNHNPVIGAANGYSFDGNSPWSPASCCYSGIPLAQSDISAAYDQKDIDKAAGFKQWSLTRMVQEWANDPSSNFGVLLNSDATKWKDHYRYFASTKNTNASLRPYLTVTVGSGTSSSGSGSTGGSTSGGTTTGDTSAPNVSIVSPSVGATISGQTVAISANASDNVGVAGVQFRLDGANIGSEDTSAPYSITWNSTSTSNGSHSLTAVARDAAGNVRTSASIAITVSNNTTPSTSSTGISSRYPGDVGIENDPNVIFSEQFEEGSISSIASRWTSVGNPDGMRLVTDVPPGSPAGHALSIPWVGGGVNNGGSLYRVLSPGINDVVYVRYYMKYPTSGNYHHTGMWLGGYNPVSAWPDPQAGSKPSGSDRFIAAAEENNITHAYEYYNYWMAMHADGTGSYWGNFLLNNPSITAFPGQWVCLEQMVKLNNPTTAFNGEHAIWINGNKVSHLGQGFPNGFWDGGRFTQNPSGQPFEGFRWRSVDALNINWIWLQNYAPDDPAGYSNTVLFDHVVVSKSYIGCMP